MIYPEGGCGVAGINTATIATQRDCVSPVMCNPSIVGIIFPLM
jgi:hypothetical protein